jgi:hypothetical protein
LIKDHPYWFTERINHPLKSTNKEGILEKIDAKTYKEMGRVPLPEGFEWDIIDPENEEAINELNDFLNLHYVTSSGGDFRL